MKKKYSVFYYLAIVALVVVLFSWLVPAVNVSNGTVTNITNQPIGLFGLVYYPVVTIASFIHIGLALMAIGGLYGVLVKTGVYSKLVNETVKKWKGKEKKFLVITIVVLAILNSLFGTTFAFFIVVPFLMGVMLKLGFNKLTTVTATVGSLLIGSLGSTFGYEIAGYANYYLGLEVFDGILFKILLLITSLVLFIFFTLSTAKLGSKKTKKATKTSTKASSKKEEKVEEEIKEEILFLEDEDVSTKKKPLAAIIVVGILLFVAIVSMFNWNNVFGVDIFEKIYELINGVKAPVSETPFLSNFADMPVIMKLLGIFSPLGYWSYYELIVLLILASLLLGWMYNIKFQDVFENFIEGAKKMVRPAIYAALSSLILVITMEGAVASFNWLAVKLLTLTDDFNVLSVLGTSLFGGALYNQFSYLVYSISNLLSVSNFSTELGVVIAFIIQSVYGVIMLIFPTSIVLVSGLGMLNVSYKDWMKHIWKFVVGLLLLVIVLAIIFTTVIQVF